MFQSGDIYRVSLDPTLGHEQAGWRPVLVFSPVTFNKAAGIPLILPITSRGSFAGLRGFTIALPPDLRTVGSVLCHQPRALDIEARGGSYVETAPAWVVDDALERLLTLLRR